MSGLSAPVGSAAQLACTGRFRSDSVPFTAARAPIEEDDASYGKAAPLAIRQSSTASDPDRDPHMDIIHTLNSIVLTQRHRDKDQHFTCTVCLCRMAIRESCIVSDWNPTEQTEQTSGSKGRLPERGGPTAGSVFICWSVVTTG